MNVFYFQSLPLFMSFKQPCFFFVYEEKHVQRRSVDSDDKMSSFPRQNSSLMGLVRFQSKSSGLCTCILSGSNEGLYW